VGGAIVRPAWFIIFIHKRAGRKAKRLVKPNGDRQSMDTNLSRSLAHVIQRLVLNLLGLLSPFLLPTLGEKQ
jgi:hypothetical protein